MARFDFMLHYCPDKSIGKLDVLSCQPDYRDRSYDNENVVLLKLELWTLQIMKEIVFEGKEQALLTNIWRDNRLDH